MFALVILTTLLDKNAVIIDTKSSGYHGGIDHIRGHG